MSVDKLDRQKVIRGSPGIGFTLTEDGNYDIKRKRISNFNNPTGDDDAVNLITIKKKCMYLDYGNNVEDDNVYNANEHILRNIKKKKKNT